MEEGTRKKVIVLTGPECTGKTTLALKLANHFHTKASEEYARSFLNDFDRPYELSDLEDIAHGQLVIEKQVLEQNSGIVILDTDLLVIYLWAKIKFRCHFDWMEEILRKQSDRLYLLCAPDIPWAPDPLRENPNDRLEIFEVYRTEMDGLELKYHMINGLDTARMKSALKAISASK